MQIPVGLKPGLWGAAAGALAMAIIGFSQMGWLTASSADQLARERADKAVVAVLAPLCVAKAQHEADKAVLTKFAAADSSYQRSDLVTKAGWATFDEQTTPNVEVARACGEALHALKPH